MEAEPDSMDLLENVTFSCTMCTS